MPASTPLALSSATRFTPLSIRAHPRSPSRSPLRKAEFTAHELDPLLGNLSPESTLQAFSAVEVTSISEQKDQDALRASIANAPTTERALGIKAALAAQKVREWLAEINSWHWPNPKTSPPGSGFLQPTGKEDGGLGAASPQEVSYLGSIRADTVRQYEKRMGEIKDGLEALDVEDLKEHVLDVHIPSRPRPGTGIGLSEAPTTGPEYGRLSDLTAVITATILQALPSLAELNTLISVWDVRTAVLFEVPELVKKFKTTKAAVEEALEEVRGQKGNSSYTKSYFEATKDRLQREVSSLGIRFDKALDLLEGHEDCLPDSWIEEMDSIESKFAHWIVEAERRVMERQLRQRNEQPMTVQQHGQIAGDVGDPSPEVLASPITHSTQFPSVVDQSAAKETDAHRSLTKQNPALDAFKHRPVRKASVKHPSTDSDSPSADAVQSRRSPVDKDKNAAKTVNEEQITKRVTPEEALYSDGHSRQQMTSTVPAMPYSPQQQDPLADLMALNDVMPPREHESQFVGLDHENDPASTDDRSTQHEPFPFLSQKPETPHNRSSKKPSLKLDLPSAYYRQGASEVSLSDSAFSEAFSDISNAEIVDATTQVLASPKINVVDNANRDELSTSPVEERPRVQSMHIPGEGIPPSKPVGEGHIRSKSLSLRAIHPRAQANEAIRVHHKRSMDDLEIYDDGLSRPLMLHRASTALVEVIPKGQVRRIDSHRKRSRDPNFVSPTGPGGGPADALRALTSSGSIRSVSSISTERLSTPTQGDVGSRDSAAGYNSTPIRSSGYAEVVTRSRAGTIDTVVPRAAAVSRQPSKRQSDVGPLTDIDPSSTSDIDDTPIPLPSTFSPFKTRDLRPSSSAEISLQSEETLEAKIKDILIKLPTRIRLTSDYDSSGSPANQSSSDSTRSSTPTPSLTLSPARQDRSGRRSNSGNSEVKVYHLVRSGQPRDAPPTKLHVRLVGENGERVMVRVGGGWADLAEYLREYSLHHGKRTIQESRFEVANLPSNGMRASDATGTPPVGPTLNPAKTRSAPRLRTGLDFGILPSLNISKVRRSTTAPISAEKEGSRSPSPASGEGPALRPPPVPVIPTSYQEGPLPESTTSPAMTTQSSSVTTEVRSTFTFIAPTPSTPLSALQAQNQNSITTTHPTITTTSAVSTPISATPSPSYTPLGAAGPKGAIKNAKARASTFSSPTASNRENEAWVQGMVGKARQVSTQSSTSPVTTITGPNYTTTTSVSTPASRRVSSAANATRSSTPPNVKAPSSSPTSTPATPDSRPGSQTPSPSPAAKDAKRSANTEQSRSKSAAGIRRVFLRRKKDK